MRKTTFLLGGAIGFLIGSRMGKEPYQKLEAKVRQTARRPQVQQAVHQAQDVAKQAQGAAAEQVKATASKVTPDAVKNVVSPEEAETPPEGSPAVPPV